MTESREYWWLDKKTASSAAFSYTNTLRTLNKDRVQRAAMYMDLYDGRARLHGDRIHPQSSPKAFSRENLVKSIVDTAMSLVAANLIRTAVLTRGAQFDVRQRAKGMEKYLDGLRAQQNATPKKRIMIRDGLLTGTGILKSIKDWKRKRPELGRVMFDEFHIDEEEAKDGCLMEAHQRFHADRFKLMAIFPDSKAAIEKAPAPALPDGGRLRNTTLVELCESYRRPSAPGEKDGRYGCFLEGIEEPLEWGVWSRDELPFIIYRWSPPTVGFFGVPIMDDICGIQQSNDFFLERIEKIIERLAFPVRNIPQEDYEDAEPKLIPDIGPVLAYKSQPSSIDAPRVLPPDLLSWVDRRTERAYRLTGIGEMSASAKKPADVRSQPALREWVNIESKRFVINIQDGEEAQLSIDRQNIAATKEMVAEGSTSVKAKWMGGDVVEEIDWSKVDLEEDAYQLSIEAASMSSLTPAARKDLAADLLNVGAIDPTTYMKLIGHPDVEAEANYLLEESRHIDKIIDDLYKEKLIQPSKIEPFQALLPRLKAALWCAMDTGASPEVVKNVNRYMTTCVKLMKELEAEEMAMAAAAAPPEPTTTPVPLGGTGEPALHAPMTQ